LVYEIGEVAPGDGNWPDRKSGKEIDGVDHTTEKGVGFGFEIGIHKRILLSQNGYLFSKEDA
jgi:hypothetical protein